MTSIHEFNGRRVGSSICELGEGASFEARTQTLWWFDITGRTLYERHLPSSREIVHALPLMASVVVPIDAEKQLLATEKGLFIRERVSGKLVPYRELEPDKPGNRSNDGRMHPSGSLWISTMGRGGEKEAGAIYHLRMGVVMKLFDRISIPNSICFSPDGRTGYYVDTEINRLMRVPLDPLTGLPQGDAVVLVDEGGKPGGMDGSICAADGTIWNARWGEGAVDRYSPEGKHLARYRVPANQPTCPVVIGKDQLAVTSAWQGLDEAARAEDPLAGGLFELEVEIEGQPEPAYLL